MIEILCMAVAVAVVAVVVMAAIMGWGRRVTRCQRYGLLMMAAGLVGAAPHVYQRGVGLGDLIFLCGLLAYLLARHLKHILRLADELDGVRDGQLTLPATTAELMARVRQVTGERVSRR